MSHSTTKGRTTTLEERIKIASFCIENGYNYQYAAKTFEVSYQQVYQWVKKFESDNERLRAENAFLKKLQELRSRRNLWLPKIDHEFKS